MVMTAGGGKLTKQQAESLWDQTIMPLGKELGLLTGYVRAQEGSSKRTAAGDPKLQKRWYDTVTGLLGSIKQRAQEVL